MDKIKVIYFKGKELPCIKEIPNTLEAMQELVGGYIECVSVGKYDIICNEEGILRELPINYEFGGYMPIAGDFFLLGSNDEGEFITLPNIEDILNNIWGDFHFLPLYRTEY